MVKETNQNDLFDWNIFLRQYSRDLLERLEDRDFEEVSSEARNSQWLGYPAATEEEISLTESRLNLSLSPSYRDFLLSTNGWLLFDDLFGGLLPVQQIERHSVRHQDLIDAWIEGCAEGARQMARQGYEDFKISDEEYFIYGSGQDSAVVRNEYLPNTLEIGGEENKGFILLNPQVTIANGEWEAWNFATWYPGAVRYRSFFEMMQTKHCELLELPKLREL
jgi:SMI1 / KNR4 family (SUKH-1)